MSVILLASVPVHGHVSPLLPLARHLASRGDTVLFLTGARFGDAVRATGAEHIALPEGADFDDRTVTSRYPEREGMPAVKAIAFDFEHIFVRPGEHQYRAVTDILRDRRVDAIVCDPLFVGASLLAERPTHERPPIVVAGVVPLSYPGPGLAPFGMGLPPLGGLGGRVRNGVLRSMTRRLFRPVDAAAQEVAGRTVGRPVSGPILDWLPRADGVVQLTVPSFEYPRPDAPDTLVFTGPVFAATSEHAAPEWWGELGGSRPVVHVTQGTIANADLSELILPTIEALATSDVLVVVATGGVPTERLGPLPANVRAAEFLPYDDLFDRTDVFVTNGGYGGTQFALAHGVPIVVAPGKEDKVEVAARVAWAGVGVNVKKQRPTPAALRTAIHAVLADPRYRDAAGRIGDDVAGASGAAGFSAAVDRVIERHAGARRFVGDRRAGGPDAGQNSDRGAISEDAASQSSSSSSRGLR